MKAKTETESTFAMARMNLFLHDFAQATIAIGETLRRPAFSAEGGRVQHMVHPIRDNLRRLDFGGDES